MVAPRSAPLVFAQPPCSVGYLVRGVSTDQGVADKPQDRGAVSQKALIGEAGVKFRSPGGNGPRTPLSSSRAQNRMMKSQLNVNCSLRVPLSYAR